MKKIHIAWLILTTVVGILILLYTFWQSKRTTQFKEQAVKTEGVVIGYNIKEGYEKIEANRKDIYAPIITYKIDNNTDNTLNYPYYNREKPYNIGDRIVVYYDKNNPKKAKIDADYRQSNKTKLTIVGLCFLCIGLAGILAKVISKP